MRLSLVRPVLLALLLLLVVGLNPALAQIPTHSYQLNGSYADANGGPALTGNGGTLTATGLSFSPNQGPSLSGAINAAHYSIEMYFRLDIVDGYRKLIDFNNRTVDSGLYNRDGILVFFPQASARAATFSPGQMAHLIVTRDSASNVFTGYVNGVSQFSFTDTTSLAVFEAPNNIVHFFQDDVVRGTEASGGFLDLINIYDRPLTQTEVSSRFAAVPEPGTVALAATGLLPLAGVALRRRRLKQQQRKP